MHNPTGLPWTVTERGEWQRAERMRDAHQVQLISVALPRGRKRRRGCLQLAGLVAGARLVLRKDRKMSYRNWMGRDIKSNPGYLNLGAPQ